MRYRTSRPARFPISSVNLKTSAVDSPEPHLGPGRVLHSQLALRAPNAHLAPRAALVARTTYLRVQMRVQVSTWLWDGAQSQGRRVQAFLRHPDMLFT